MRRNENEELTIMENQTLIGKFFKKVVEKPIFVSILTVAITIVGTGGTILLNKNGEKVVTKVSYNFSGYSKNEFPDGSILGISDVLSAEVISKIASEHAQFSNLKVEEMFAYNSGVSIKEVKDTTLNDYYFEIKMPTKFVGGNVNKTIKLIEVINETFINLVIEKQNSLLGTNIIEANNVDFDHIYSALTYYEILDNLKVQDQIIRQIDNTVNATSTKVNNKFNEKYVEYQRWVNNELKLVAFENEIINNQYVRNFTKTKQLASANIKEIETKIALNEAKIDALTTKYLELTAGKDSVETNSIISILSSYIAENAELETKLELFKGFDVVVSDHTDVSFEQKIRTVYLQMGEFIEQLNDEYITFELNNIKTNYIDGEKYAVEKPHKTTVFALGSLVIGFGLSGVILLVVDEIKKGKANKEIKKD